MAWFRNHYRCDRCNKVWTDEWSATCDDDCPHCGARHMSPYNSEDLPRPSKEEQAAVKVKEKIPSAQKISDLNDAFRTSFRGGQVMMTASVHELPDMVKANALVKVAEFNEFNADNDPHGEHDFGSFELCGRKFFWKIDYYDRELKFGSDDPADTDKTTRVLTLMLAEDY